jgi:hypothetical protein
MRPSAARTLPSPTRTGQPGPRPKLPPLTADQQELVKTWLPWVWREACSFARCSVRQPDDNLVDDLFGHAMIAACKAAQRFQPGHHFQQGKPISIIGFAKHHVLGALRNAMTNFHPISPNWSDKNCDQAVRSYDGMSGVHATTKMISPSCGRRPRMRTSTASWISRLFWPAVRARLLRVEYKVLRWRICKGWTLE